MTARLRHEHPRGLPNDAESVHSKVTVSLSSMPLIQPPGVQACTMGQPGTL